ncbi:hypothetical protein [Streptomyces sp. NPDC060194]|uniref:hypothetical protein n=1 Tax=Streptomyces sp. NPDC060194 TaxID=3347069 RepID=UPI0036591DFC
MRIRAELATVAVALTLLAGCSGGSDDSGGDDRAERPTYPRTATGTLEELAEQASCDPNVQTDAAELRQANCRTKDGRYILTTFATDRGLREWINESKDYGGTYLVGRKWVASGDGKVVTALRGRLGGTVESSSHHSGGDHGSGGGGTEDEHSGHH